MNTKLFIPNKIKVGYQKRNDTYTKKLAYVIYFDEKGVLRKEKSWEGWRDKTIEAEEFDNKPHNGFVLNKGILRDGYWGGGHNMVRIYDDRGIEFEITVSNLMFILMGNDCNKRALDCEFIYAWNGTELVLLPVTSEEFKISTEFTSLKSNKVSAKDMAVNIGCIFKTKSLDEWVYLGKIEKNEVKHSYNKTTGMSPRVFVRDKVNVFWDLKNNNFIFETGFTKISHIISTEKVTNLEELFENYYNSHYYVLVKNTIIEESNSLDEFFLPENQNKGFEESGKQIFFKDNMGNYYTGSQYYYFYTIKLNPYKHYYNGSYPFNGSYPDYNKKSVYLTYQYKKVEVSLELTNGKTVKVTPNTIGNYYYEKK